MTGIFKKKRLEVATIAYWLLLFYIIAALIWWFIALQQQSHQTALYKLEELKAGDPAFLQKVEAVTAEEKRKNAQYIGEGFAFLLVILIGALYVYRAVRRQIKMTLQQQNFMMAITHELKTPIAIAKLNLETLHKHTLDQSKQQKLLLATLQEVNRLNTLTNNILVSSQLEDGGYKLLKEELDLSLLTANCVQDFHSRFADRKMNSAVEEDIDISGDALLLQIMINNLLDNAVKYAPKESRINFSLYKNALGIFLKCADEGPGIADEEKNKVFDRFYRIGNEQVRKAKGTGLGLYLCKKIAADHNADISVTNNHPAGSIFTVHFYL
ncbi:MAG TPA: ATP-binding protein [Chitinophagaceae bacterium]|nr:ATP-binding protein [Chitinophagaceae bacterium]